MEEKESEEKKSRLDEILDYIKKLYNLAKIYITFKSVFMFTTGVFTIVGAVYACFSYHLDKSQQVPIVQRSEMELLRDSILENIKIIDETFHPETIPGDLDTTKYFPIAKIREFQILTLEYSSMWKMVDNDIRCSNSDAIRKSYRSLSEFFQNRELRNFDFMATQFQIIGIIAELYVYGEKNGLSFYKDDGLRFAEMLEKMASSDTTPKDEINNLFDEIDMLKKKYNINETSNVDDLPEEILELGKRLWIIEDEYYHTKEKYQSDLHFLREVIKFNDQYSIGVKRFQLEVK